MSHSRDVITAEEVARAAHYGMKDKAGVAYILHPERVAGRVRTLESKVVAWLHDVVEDTDVNLDDIRARFGNDTADSVRAITHRKGEPWSDYLVRVKKDPIARKVKIADLIDNANLSRIPEVTERDVRRTEKYIRALYFLMDLDGE